MPHDRLKLVVPEDNANAVTDDKTDRLAMPAIHDAGMRPLHVADTDEGLLPDDAA